MGGDRVWCLVMLCNIGPLVGGSV
uniref:Uncharacterized protein n=1 Tax=Arundo donax TaxID=35708 RepID=A0A0A9ASF5_ARUDO